MYLKIIAFIHITDSFYDGQNMHLQQMNEIDLNYEEIKLNDQNIKRKIKKWKNGDRMSTSSFPQIKLDNLMVNSLDKNDKLFYLQDGKYVTSEELVDMKVKKKKVKQKLQNFEPQSLWLKQELYDQQLLLNKNSELAKLQFNQNSHPNLTTIQLNQNSNLTTSELSQNSNLSS